MRDAAVSAGLWSSLGGNGEGRVGVMAARQLIPVQVGDIQIQVEAVSVSGTEQTSGLSSKTAGNVLEVFGRTQDTIVEVAKSTARVIEGAGNGGAAGPGGGGVRVVVLGQWRGDHGRGRYRQVEGDTPPYSHPYHWAPLVLMGAV